MAVKLKWPWLGIAIPIALISFIGYSAHIFILSRFLSKNKQVIYQLSMTMIWISYYLAIKTNPGRPPKKYRPPKQEWENYCRKCETFKPQRTHHCKTCNQCVLCMDHHCPWTMNCVGYKNFPHFMRFLFWLTISTANLLNILVRRIIYLWHIRHSSLGNSSSSEIVFLYILTPMDAFVLITILILMCRCLYTEGFKGMTQIESWELERIENLFDKKLLLPQLLKSLDEKHPDIIEHRRQEINSLLSTRNLRFESVVNFPYNVNPWINITNTLGPIYLWLWPFGEPSNDGTSFEKNDLSEFDESSSIQDMLLSLPWPPDGGRHQINDTDSTMEAGISGGERVVRKKWIDPRDKLTRNKWYNDWGEDLSDFGVDIEVE